MWSVICMRARYEGPVEEGVEVTNRTKVKFAWRLLAEGVDIVKHVELLCWHALQRGIIVPSEWKQSFKTGLGVSALEEFAEKACQRARAEMCLGNDVKLDCRTPAEFAMNHVASVRVLMFVWSQACVVKVR